MRVLGKLLIFLSLAPGAVLAIWSLASMYQGISAGRDPDSDKIAADIGQSMRWLVAGIPFAIAGVVMWVMGSMRKRRRD